MAPSPPAVYTQEQLDEYFARIQFKERVIAREDAGRPAGLAFLTALQRQQVGHVPFENLALHYSPTRHVSTSPRAVYEKLVGRRRGGFCMENNGFFGTVLRTLGFRLYSAGGRVAERVPSDESRYIGWSHMVNIVFIDGAKYLVDVGFGSYGPSQPLRLRDGEESQDGANCHRLLWTNIPDNTDADQRLWVLQVRPDAQAPWAFLYCFSELEFLPADYDNMNFAVSYMPTSFIKYTVMCTRHDVEDGAVVGTVTLMGAELRKRRKNEVVLHKTCANEQERLQALEEHFGIVLTDEERAAIRSTATELRG